MKVACLQMDMKLGAAGDNLAHAEKLLTEAAKQGPDVLLLPETWNTGFFPKEGLSKLSSASGADIDALVGGVAKKYGVNVIAGSVSNLRDGRVYNTAFMYDRHGRRIAEYDKTHLFTPMGEDGYYARGDRLCVFKLDEVDCGVMICYDLRFPELARSLVLSGLNVLFVVSQWPRERIFHLKALLTARAIENQCFAVCCNSCGSAEGTVFGGSSLAVDPLGAVLASCGEKEEIMYADLDLKKVAEIRESIPVLRDRRPELYKI